MTKEGHAATPEAGNPAHERRIVGEHAIAVEFFDLLEQLRDVIQRERALRVARELGNLPGGKVAENLSRELARTLLQASNLLRDIEFRVVAHFTQRFNFCLEFGDRLLKVEELIVDAGVFTRVVARDLDHGSSRIIKFKC